MYCMERCHCRITLIVTCEAVANCLLPKPFCLFQSRRALFLRSSLWYFHGVRNPQKSLWHQKQRFCQICPWRTLEQQSSIINQFNQDFPFPKAQIVIRISPTDVTSCLIELFRFVFLFWYMMIVKASAKCIPSCMSAVRTILTLVSVLSLENLIPSPAFANTNENVIVQGKCYKMWCFFANYEKKCYLRSNRHQRFARRLTTRFEYSR